jgi:eukaryotic-like serine/threonine-protein kinase
MDESPERWRRISSLFDEAVKLPPEGRAAFLDAACGDDPGLRAEVARLLESADQAEGFLEKPLVSQAGPLLREAMEDFEPSTATPPPEDPAGTSTLTTPAPSGLPAEHIGPYRLLQKIGEGGMGEVWLAEQTEPVRRRVALKLIKAGMDTKQVIARFEAERQALALMDHPAIAKVYEAGETPRGLPYFAMEYVAGEPINTYCDRHRLGMPERLELFERVCDGVQHAHQKGVIHRDLKPSNVLVAIQDGKPVPKIIDFGVAKATAQRLTEKTMFTELGVLIGTPEYMSPEQAEMTGLDVDTRTDVYALGVMLYELLTGALPFESKELRQAGYDEIRRRIREVDPPRPSTRISTLGDASTESAHNRRTEPSKLVSQIKGDLDWITMKALEKDRTRRYGSPAELAADLGRHIRHEPVLAGPPSAVYRSRKFVRRHRLGVAVATLAVLSLAGFGVTMAMQARRIAREYTRAERVSEFLVDLFKVSDPSEARGNAVTAREILDKGVEKVQRQLSGEPEVMARLMLTMGRVYTSLGLGVKAEPLIRKSVELRRQVLGSEHPDTLRARSQLAWVTGESLGHFSEAEKMLREVLQAQERVLGDENLDTLQTMNSLGVMYERMDRYEESGRFYRKALDGRRRLLPPGHPDLLWSLNNVASNSEFRGDLPKAEKLYREVAERRRIALGPDHPDTLTVLSHLARVVAAQGRHSEAEKLYQEVIDGKSRVLGKDHASTLYSRGELMLLYADEHRYEEAEKLYRELIETRLRLYGPERLGTLGLMNNMGEVYIRMRRLDDADRLLTKACETVRRLFSDEHGFTSICAFNLALVAAGHGRQPEALEWLRKAVEEGFQDANEMMRQPYLESLHGHPEFVRLVDQTKKNAERSGGAP